MRIFKLPSIVVVISLSLVLIPSLNAEAMEFSESDRELVELEVLNKTSDKVRVNLGLTSVNDRGGSEPKALNSTPAPPGEGFDIESGGTSPAYGVNYIGSWEGATGPYIAMKFKYKNFFNVQVSSPVKSSVPVSQATLEHDGEFYSTDPIARKQLPTKLINTYGDLHKFNLEEVSNPAKGFDKKYRLTISGDGPQEDDQPVREFKVKKLTGNSVERPVYKVTVGETQRKLKSLPSELKIKPYAVFGNSVEDGRNVKVGDVVPVGKPTLDRANMTMTIPKATFFYEQPEGQPGLSRLTVVDDAGVAETLDLYRAPGPPATLNQSAITSIGVRSGTGMPVTANGVAQEALKLNLEASGTVGPDHRPELTELYDHVYFRDGSGKLITGMYEDPKDGGYAAVSNTKGNYVNALGAMTQQDSNLNRVYLSTTKKTGTTVKAELKVTKSQQSADTRVERSDAFDTVQGTATSGVALGRGIADSDIGAYHHFNGEIPEASLITRYQAFPSLNALSFKNPYAGHLIRQNEGTVAVLNQPDRFDSTPRVQSHLVNTDGTYVSVPNLETGLDIPESGRE